jgi:hypothetical protein
VADDRKSCILMVLRDGMVMAGMLNARYMGAATAS